MLPDLYFYNPTCEIAVSNDSANFMPNALLRKMESDLDLLPATFAKEKDLILLRKFPKNAFVERLEEIGIGPFGFGLVDQSLKDPDFISKPKNFLYPWGWSPAVHKLLDPLKPSCDTAFLTSPVASWRTVHKELYSRKEGRGFLKSVLEYSGNKWLTPLEELPEICTTHSEILSLQQKWTSVIIKSPWSSSGRGLQILRPGEYNRTNYQVIEGFLKQQGYVMVEHRYEKLLDFSLQFYSKGTGEVDFRGITSFATDQSGKYKGSYLEKLPQEMDPELNNFMEEHLGDLKKIMTSLLQQSRWSYEYQGWLGFDAIVYRSADQKLKIQPCIEVNCRFTMGTISLALRKRMIKGSTGFLKIEYFKHGQVQEYFQEMSSRFPLLLEDGKIVRGFIPLTEASYHTRFAAFLLVENRSRSF